MQDYETYDSDPIHTEDLEATDYDSDDMLTWSELREEEEFRQSSMHFAQRHVVHYSGNTPHERRMYTPPYMSCFYVPYSIFYVGAFSPTYVDHVNGAVVIKQPTTFLPISRQEKNVKRVMHLSLSAETGRYRKRGKYARVEGEEGLVDEDNTGSSRVCFADGHFMYTTTETRLNTVFPLGDADCEQADTFEQTRAIVAALQKYKHSALYCLDWLPMVIHTTRFKMEPFLEKSHHRASKREQKRDIESMYWN